jgi:hypothetical protein
MSFKTEVLVDGKWGANAVRFATENEAIEYGRELLSRWLVPTDSRPAPSDDPVNYKFDVKSYSAVRL